MKNEKVYKIIVTIINISQLVILFAMVAAATLLYFGTTGTGTAIAGTTLFIGAAIYALLVMGKMDIYKMLLRG